nr:MFS transporter [Nakamurella flavida]
MEWFDWSIYATFSPFFAASFFPADHVQPFLATMAVLAVGCLARPVGGYLFGRLSDRRGRAVSMRLTVLLLALGGLVIGLCPSWAVLGWGAPALLVLARIAQGTAYGGDQPATQAYLAEVAPVRRRGVFSSLVYLFGAVGTLAGMVTALALTVVLPTTTMHAWGWRVPFLLGGCGALWVLVMRRRMPESPMFVPAADAPVPAARPRLSDHRRPVALVVGLCTGLAVATYFWVVALPAYLIAERHVDAGTVLTATAVAQVALIVWLPVWGALSDRIGRRPVLAVGFLGSIAAAFPLSALVNADPGALLLALVIALFFLAAPLSVAPAVMCELFPTHIRTLGSALPYAITVSVFGGCTPYLQAWLTGRYGSSAFTGFLVVCLLVSLITVIPLPETRGRLLDEVPGPTGRACPETLPALSRS